MEYTVPSARLVLVLDRSIVVDADSELEANEKVDEYLRQYGEAEDFTCAAYPPVPDDDELEPRDMWPDKVD